jgi:glyoxylase-like metal-dependent hydrolase (beta-lactamase superfamily II)
VEQLGYSASDVSDIVLTHLDKDHAGGLMDFPQARVHVHPAELFAAQKRWGLIARERYSRRQLAHGPLWSPMSLESPTDWHGTASFPIPDLPNMLMVSLPGHSAGHCGVAIQRDDGTWLLHCGDAVYHRGWLYGLTPPLALRVVERLLMHDPMAWLESLRKLQRLVHVSGITICSSHDPVAFAELAASPPA